MHSGCIFPRPPFVDYPGALHSGVHFRMGKRGARDFWPIGIENSGWDWQVGGGNIDLYAKAHSGLRLTAREFARLGYMLSRGGKWKDEQIVPKGWIDLATRRSQSVNLLADLPRTAACFPFA